MRDWNFFPDKSKKIAVGLSGGVDSAVAAARLVKMEYQVVGFWMWLVEGCAQIDHGSLRLPRQKFFSSNRARIRLVQQYSQRRDAVNTKKENFCQAPREPYVKNNNCLTAFRVCQFLKIPFYVVDLRKEFKKQVIDYFLQEYESGKTPNPCIVCNQKIKFGQMLKIATQKLKANYLATGHYVRIVKVKRKDSFGMQKSLAALAAARQAAGQAKVKSGPIYHLLSGVDEKKDQSYFLYTLDQKKLAKLVFPNGDFFKEETRKIAKKWQLPTKDIVESENICFISKLKEGNSYKEKFKCFLIKNLKPKLGLVVDTKGNVLGTHGGLCFYTIGSRGGWEIKVKSKKSKVKSKSRNIKWIGKDWPRLYVVRKDKKKNQLVVGRREQASKKEFEVGQISWINNEAMRQSTFAKASADKWDNGAMNCLLKVRSVGKFLKAKLKKVKNRKIRVVLEKPELGIASGQSAVFYQSYSEVLRGGNTQGWYEVIGGGVIR